MVWDQSNWDQANWGDDQTNINIDDLKIGNPKHAADALLAVTAAAQVDLLVTEDVTFARRIQRSSLNLKVASYDEFVQLHLN